MKIPLFPLDAVLFPGAALPLHIFEERYKKMIGQCLERKEEFGVVRAERDGLAVIGCTAEIIAVLNRYPDGRLDIVCHGRNRFEIQLLDDSRIFLQAEVDLLRDDGAQASRAEREQCAALHFELLELTGNEDDDSATQLNLNLDQPISFQLAHGLPVDLNFKQVLLGITSDAERTARLLEFYASVMPKLRKSTETRRVAGHNGRIM